MATNKSIESIDEKAFQALEEALKIDFDDLAPETPAKQDASEARVSEPASRIPNKTQEKTAAQPAGGETPRNLSPEPGPKAPVFTPANDGSRKTPAAILKSLDMRSSRGPIRMAVYGAPSAYQQTANEETLCIPMIETKTAVENLESILDVKGVSGVYIGPSDLGFSYGLHPTLDRTEPQILEIYEKIVKACEARGIYPGIHCSGHAGATLAIQRGFKLVTVLNDSGLLAMCAKSHIGEIRKNSGGKA